MTIAEWYDHTTYPSPGAQGSSSAARSEFEAIQNGLSAKLPDFAGNGSKIIAVNSGATKLEAITTTGTGSGVRATSPALETPTIGVATATSINKNIFTTPATSCTWTLTNGKTFTVSNTLTLAGTDGSTLNVGTGGTLGTAAYTASSAYLSSSVTVTVAQGGTGATTFTDGGVIIGNSTGALQVTTAGTSGQVLTSNGAGVDPTFQTSVASAMVLLATLTPTAAANVDALTTFTSSYDSYLIIGTGLSVAADDFIRFRFAVAGTADAGSNYYTVDSYNAGTNTVSVTSGIVNATTTSAGIGANFKIEIFNANDATRLKTCFSTHASQLNATPGYTNRIAATTYSAANAISGIRFLLNGGNNFGATGKIRIYGIANS